MFPYTEEENAWISGSKLPKIKTTYDNRSLFISMIVALGAALFSTLIPTLIYFFRLNLL